MIAEEIPQDPELRLFSTVKDADRKGKADTQILIQPWNIDAKFAFKTKLCFKSGRLQTIENRNTQRKKSVDERIGQMYRKYSNEGSFPENDNSNILNSRQIYRQKLKQFQNASEFRRMGSKREAQCQQLSVSEQKQCEQLSFRKPSLYCCDYKEFRMISEADRKIKPQYKFNDKFQRMLKIKDKIRKKNSLTVSKQKEKYQSQYQPEAIYQQKEACYAIMAKATLERNKMKLKMRGLSKQDIRRKKEFSSQLSNTGSFSCQAKHIPAKGSKELFSLMYQKWKSLDGDGLAQKMSQTLPYFKR